MKNTNKRILSFILAIVMLVGMVTPAFAEINVDGGSSSVSGSATGKGSYNNSDQMWKVTVFYARYDTTDEDTSSLANTKYWRKYGDSIYIYHPTAVRGTSGKIKLNYFQSALFVSGNKAEFLYNSGGDISKASSVLSNLKTYSSCYFYSDTSSPAIAMNGYTIDSVKEYFKDQGTLRKLIQEITKWKKGSWSTANFYSLLDSGNNAFSIDGFNKVDKTSNSGKSATSGYSWSSSTYLNGSDWYYGVKTDYNGNRIYMYPKGSDNTTLNATAWMIVYEPVLLVQPNVYPILGGNSYEFVACTPTEFALLDYHLSESQFGLGSTTYNGGLRKAIYNMLSNSTYLDEKWCSISKRSSTFAYNTDLSRIFKEAGIGMALANPYNYVIKDYKAQISAPKTVKAEDTFSITFTFSVII